MKRSTPEALMSPYLVTVRNPTGGRGIHVCARVGLFDRRFRKESVSRRPPLLLPGLPACPPAASSKIILRISAPGPGPVMLPAMRPGLSPPRTASDLTAAPFPRIPVANARHAAPTRANRCDRIPKRCDRIARGADHGRRPVQHRAPPRPRSRTSCSHRSRRLSRTTTWPRPPT